MQSFRTTSYTVCLFCSNTFCLLCHVNWKCYLICSLMSFSDFRFLLDCFWVLWRPRFCYGSSAGNYTTIVSWDFQCPSKGHWFPSSENTVFERKNCPTSLFSFHAIVFSDALSFFHFVCCRNLAVSSSKYSLFVLSRFCLSAFVVLWRPCFSCGCDHMGYLVPASWESTTWNIGNPYFINCKPCFFLEGNFVQQFHIHNALFWRAGFCPFREAEFFYTVG